MRYLLFGLAAVACLASLGVSLVEGPRVWSILSLVLAGALLLAGFQRTAAQRQPQDISLDDQQRETIAKLKGSDQYGLALRQVKMWFRDADDEIAREIVDEVPPADDPI